MALSRFCCLLMQEGSSRPPRRKQLALLFLTLAFLPIGLGDSWRTHGFEPMFLKVASDPLAWFQKVNKSFSDMILFIVWVWGGLVMSWGTYIANCWAMYPRGFITLSSPSSLPNFRLLVLFEKGLSSLLNWKVLKGELEGSQLALSESLSGNIGKLSTLCLNSSYKLRCQELRSHHPGPGWRTVWENVPLSKLRYRIVFW